VTRSFYVAPKSGEKSKSRRRFSRCLGKPSQMAHQQINETTEFRSSALGQTNQAGEEDIESSDQ
jgi:hypothetical protein